MTERVEILKASPLVCPVGGIVIEITKEVPEVKSLNEARALYATQGIALADALSRSLPGGTMDALLAELLQRRASLFRVPFAQG